MPSKLPTLEDVGTYLFCEEFNSETCAKAIRFILEKNLMSHDQRPKHLKLVVSSTGGEVSPCFALIDAIYASRIPVHTVGLGEISSCGLFLFMAGKKGERVLTPNTLIMSHQFSWGSEGKAHELFAMAKAFSLTQSRIMDHYRRCTGLTEKKIRQTLLPAEDVWLSAEEAVALKVADKITTVF